MKNIRSCLFWSLGSLFSGYIVGHVYLSFFPLVVAESSLSKNPSFGVIRIKEKARTVKPVKSNQQLAENGKSFTKIESRFQDILSLERLRKFHFRVATSDGLLYKDEFARFGLPSDGLDSLEKKLADLKAGHQEHENNVLELLHQDQSEIVILIPNTTGIDPQQSLRNAINEYTSNEELQNFLMDSLKKNLGNSDVRVSGLDKVILIRRTPDGTQWRLREGTLALPYTAQNARQDKISQLIEPHIGGGQIRHFSEIPEEFSHLLEKQQN
jgi:hypothetical protein